MKWGFKGKYRFFRSHTLRKFHASNIGLSAEYGGYIGWEKYGDAPMTLKTCLSYDFNNLTLKLQHQAGLTDWPFHQIRFGAEYRFRFRDVK